MDKNKLEELRKNIGYIDHGDREDKNVHYPINIMWGIKKFGFGEISFYFEDNKWKIDAETLDKDFVKMILNEFVDRAELIENFPKK